MTGSIDLTPDELRKQAKDLRDFARDLRQAGTSAASRDLNSYGAIGQLWAWTMNDRFDRAEEFTGASADAAETLADELDVMAADYDNREATHAATMDRIGGEPS